MEFVNVAFSAEMRIPRYREKMSQTNANFWQTEQTGGGVGGEFWQEPLRDTKVLFCGHDVKFFHPKAKEAPVPKQHIISWPTIFLGAQTLKSTAKAPCSAPLTLNTVGTPWKAPKQLFDPQKRMTSTHVRFRGGEWSFINSYKPWVSQNVC